jgi:hypothetical protein
VRVDWRVCGQDSRRTDVDPDLRNALLIAGLIFVGLFGAMTISVILEDGLDVLTVAALLIVGMLVLPLIGALRNPPK